MLSPLSALSAGRPRVVPAGVRRGSAALLLSVLLAAPSLPGATEAAEASGRSESYYHFALGHLYHQFAQQFMRQEYVDRAVDEYKQALESDPGSLVIRTELINLYAGSNQLPEAEALAEEILAEAPDNIEVRRQLGSIYRSYATKQRQAVDTEFLKRAIEQFEKVAAFEPDNAENHLALGLLYRSTGNPSEAEKAFLRTLELDPSRTEARVNLAYLLLEAGKLKAGIEALEAIVGAGPSDTQHLNALASAYEQAGRPTDAAKIYQQLVDQGRNTLQARRRLAENLVLSRQYGEALQQYAELLELDPSNAEHYLRISLIERERKDYKRAWQALENARRLDPDSVGVQFSAIHLLEAEGKLEQAARETRKLLASTRKAEYSPEERERRWKLFEMLGSLQGRLGEHEAAADSFRRMGSLEPRIKPHALALVVETWRRARDYSRAEKEARKAAAEFDAHPGLADLLATILADRGKTGEAVKAIERAYEDSAADIDALLAMARIYERGRQFEKAAALIDQASGLAETDQARIRILFAYGSLHERAKDYEESESKFRELLAIDPENAGAMNYLGYMFADRNVNLDEAHDLIQRALDLDPENGAYLDSLGWVYFRQNKLELAAKFLERSLEQLQGDPVIHSHLGDVYHRQGRTQEAKDHWSRGLEELKKSAPADRDTDEIEKLKRKLAALEVSLLKDARSREGKEKVRP